LTEWELLNQSAQVYANTPVDFTVEGPYIHYRWFLDGVQVQEGINPTYTFNRPPEVYELVVVVTNSQGDQRSGRCWVTTAVPDM